MFALQHSFKIVNFLPKIAYFPPTLFNTILRKRVKRSSLFYRLSFQRNICHCAARILKVWLLAT